MIWALIISLNMDSLFRILNKYDPDKKIQIMWDEWGEWLQEMSEVSALYEETTLLDALSSGVQLNLFMNYPDRIRFSCAAQVINVLHSLFHTNKANGELVKTPVFYVFKMYKPHHTANISRGDQSLKTAHKSNMSLK
jgi:alpha-N-arabinofuranosidase